MAHENFHAVVIRCQDGRLGTVNAAWLTEMQKSGPVDDISVPGAIKEIVDWYGKSWWRRFLAGVLMSFGLQISLVMRGLEVAVNLHGITTIYLQAHRDCGAYNGSRAFSESITEKTFHLAQIKQAAEIIRKHFKNPKLEIHLKWVELREHDKWEIADFS